MKFHNPFQRHTATKYIKISTGLCEACWSCLEACPNQVLGKIEIGPHSHIHVDRQENCKGCKKCVLACPHAAIEYVYRPKYQENTLIN
jgi:Fe-S-cluster-containing hydrogenase component 2